MPISWMEEHVFLEVTSVCAWVGTLCAAERLSAWMGEHVFLEVTSLCAGVVALFAKKRLLSTMNPHVDFQLRSTDGWETTLVARVRLLSTVLKHVCFKVFAYLEGDRALNTWVGVVFSLHFHCGFPLQHMLDNWTQQKLFPKLVPFWKVKVIQSLFTEISVYLVLRRATGAKKMMMRFFIIFLLTPSWSPNSTDLYLWYLFVYVNRQIQKT